MKDLVLLTACLWLLGFLLATAGAAEIKPDVISFNGFGTVGATYHHAEDLEYRRLGSQPQGTQAGEINLSTDSVFGAQVDASINEDVQLVAQGIYRLSSDDEWRAQFARGFLRYAPDEALLFRAGRIGYDVFMLAESPNVGYSYLPIRPAPEFFGLFASDAIDGADAAITYPLFGGMTRTRLFAGESFGDQVSSNRTRTQTHSDVLGGTFDYTYQAWILRFGAIGVHVKRAPSLRSLTDALRSTGVSDAQRLADDLDRTGEVYAVQLAAAYDENPWKVQMLLTRADSNFTLGPKLNSAVATVGFHRDRATPFLSIASVKTFANVRTTGLPDAPAFDALSAAAEAVQKSAQSTQRTLSAGVRCDLTPHMDLKFQVDHVWSRESIFVFDRSEPPHERAQLTLFGLAFDFIF